MGMRGVSTASIEEKFFKKLMTKMWLISPRDFNHIFVINGPPGTPSHTSLGCSPSSASSTTYEQSKEHHKWKGRIVLSGDKIKTAMGDWAVFAELGHVPSTMSACRALLSVFVVTDDLILLQSDCVRAYVPYVQAVLKGPPIFIRLPKAWQPEAWPSFKDPVCRLVKALYGHPHAGDFWHDRFQAELITLVHDHRRLALRVRP